MTMQVSAAHISYPANKVLLWSGRALLGIPVAFSVTTSPMLLSEISPYEYSGLTGALFQFFTNGLSSNRFWNRYGN